MNPDETHRALLSLSHELGLESRGLAILGEGNTSARMDADTFLVKASGSTLGTLDAAGLVRCRFEPLLALLERADTPGEQEIEDTLLAARVDPTSRKPSVECLFHAHLLTLPGVGFVGHTHPVRTLAILCAADPALVRAFAAERRLPDEVVCTDPVSLLLPYVDPGLALSRAIAAGVAGFRRDHGDRVPRVILLESHGVITVGGTPGAVLTAMRMTEKAATVFMEATLLGGGRLPRALPDADVAHLDRRLDEIVRRCALHL